MRITQDEVTHIAALARLSLTEGEASEIRLQLDGILGYIEKLNSIDTSGVEPTSHVLAIDNVFRKDEARPSLPHEEALLNSPEPSEKYYVVPKIIE